MSSVEQGRKLYRDRHPNRGGAQEPDDQEQEPQTSGVQRGREMYKTRHPGRFQAAGREPGTEAFGNDSA